MTPEFDYVRDAFGASIPGRLLASVSDALDRAWRSSIAGRTIRSAANSITTSSTASSIRIAGVAVCVAAAMQPLLIALMTQTVRPTLPWWGFVSIALLAAMIASQAESIVVAWPSSRLRRSLDR